MKLSRAHSAFRHVQRFGRAMLVLFDKSKPLTGTRPEDRPLTDAERTLLQWLTANSGPEAQQYASQISQVRVVANCTCGCPTIDLANGERQHRTVGASLVLADFDGVTPEGIEVGLILHAREGQLSELEVYAMHKVDGPFSLPTIESLRGPFTNTSHIGPN